ncbi:juvenile hormone esterase-like isoform X1 [Diorhabda sublineata]|uniref:juvenile hormone esterase-like isoform X1 n=1 Tax=Diorhabda sublineata TaxID=1163346 RepID=UPI0024E15B6D|nr:juvenile hormone esterase-like isoform X1 [Diorhabda sublineata]
MDSPVVTVSEGRLRGRQSDNLDGEKFYSFLGIPYAQPPIGELRFKAPEAVKAWNDIKDATRNPNQCIQRNDVTNIIEGSEDCLYLNVYTKSLPSDNSDLKPVMVWIHGGGFIMGSNNTKLYGPEHLMIEDIVLVCVNFRLGFLGHLFFNDTSLNIHGNAGLKDQQLALEWIQRNIKNFNGDPDNVTIFGESSGSASVHYHITSSRARGLFHKAILQSGCSFCPWARVDEKKYNNFAVQLAQIMNNNVKTEEEAMEVLMKLSAEDLYVTQEKFILKYGRIGKICPNIEKPNPTAIIPNSPDELIVSGKYNQVPMLIGFTNSEGLLYEIYQQKELRKGLTPINYFGVENCIHPHLQLTESDPKRQVIIDKLKKTYFDKANINKYMLTTDYYYIAPIMGAAKLHAKTSPEPVYLFNISLDAGLNYCKRLNNLTHLAGTCHADELGYLFNISSADDYLQKGPTEILAVRRLVKLWTNFAKYGNPTPEGNDLNVTWKPIDEENLYFLDIGEELALDNNPVPERMKIWKEIFQLSPDTKYYLQ